MIIHPDILSKRFDNAKTFEQKIIVKILALKQLGVMLGFKNNNPYISGKQPFERYIIKQLINRMHTSGLPSYIYFATSELLDYYCPFWKECVDPKILGLVVSRNSKEYRKWVKDVLQRDNYSCQDCGSKDNLQAHHIEPYSQNPYMRVVLENGVTLCGECHSNQHNDMGKGMFV